jgi:hypothetical protein
VHFWGLVAKASYYRRFLKDFSRITTPLRALLKEDAKFQWTDECKEVSNTLSTRSLLLQSSLYLISIDHSQPFQIVSDHVTLSYL